MRSDTLPRPPAWANVRVARAQNDLVWGEDGREFIDMHGGYGATLLGHNDPAITAAVREQLGSVWTTGALPCAIRDAAHAAIDALVPASHRLVGLYSTGMESAELALRIARTVTGRSGVLGFARAMHGKSMAMAHLGWDNPGIELPTFVRVPYVPFLSEESILQQVVDHLKKRQIAAVFIEPLQGSAGGHCASQAFFRALSTFCHQTETLLVVDEILSGFYRTGSLFLHREFDMAPDMVLIGKAMGNGFPVSGVVLGREHPVVSAALPGSTFSSNPLAAAAVVATLGRMKELDAAALVGRLSQVMKGALAPLDNIGVPHRGMGALSVIELPSPAHVAIAAQALEERGVLASTTGPYVRLLPAATIHPDHLQAACAAVVSACTQAMQELGHVARLP